MDTESGPGDRLSQVVSPQHYRLLVKTDLEELAFSGCVSIKIKLNKSVSSITLHAGSQLQIFQVLVTKQQSTSSAKVLEHTRVVRNDQLERLTIHLASSLEKSSHDDSRCWVHLAFRGHLNDVAAGYYKNTYEDNGEKKYFALTHFEPTYARSAFPCFDEPVFKTTFDISLLSRKGTISISNTHLESTVSAPGALPTLDEYMRQSTNTAIFHAGDKTADPDLETEWTLTQFATTPHISSYLIAYANGSLAFKETRVKSSISNAEILIRVYCIESKINSVHTALEMLSRSLLLCEEMFRVPYPLNKLDVVAAPDFEIGAMENWGMITGRQKNVLYNAEQSGITDLMLMASMLTHEVSHQWFGNLVTMEFWDGLWLKEAFATLMGSLIIPDTLYPDWNMVQEFMNIELKKAFHLDSSRGTHPIEMPCNDSRFIGQAFDDIAYCKGPVVLRQLVGLIGTDSFLKGISNYLNKYKYGTANTADVWNALSEASGRDVASIMHEWISRPGYPVITVEETDEGLSLRQDRFMATTFAINEEEKTLWHVPLRLKIVDDNGNMAIDSQLCFHTQTIDIPLPNVKNKLYKLNADGFGLYQTFYPAHRWEIIAREAGNPESLFSTEDKIELIQNALMLSKARYIKTTVLLDLISKVKVTEPVLWREIIGVVLLLRSLFWEQSEGFKSAFNRFCRSLFKELIENINLDPQDNESKSTREWRIVSVRAALICENEKIINEIKHRFKAVMKENDYSLIHHDLTKDIFQLVVRLGDESVHNKMLEINMTTSNDQRKVCSLEALGHASNAELLQRSFDLILSDKVRDQERQFLVRALADNHLSRRHMWTFIKNNFHKLESKFCARPIFGYILLPSMSSLTSSADLKDVESFFIDKDTRGFKYALEEGIDSVRGRSEWLEHGSKEVEKWLERH